MSVKAGFRQDRQASRCLGGCISQPQQFRAQVTWEFTSQKAWWTQKEEREASMVKDGSHCIYTEERSRKKDTQAVAATADSPSNSPTSGSSHIPT